MSLSNKTPLNNTDGVWGLAMAQQNAFMDRIASEANNFHVIVTFHKKMIGPPKARNTDDDVTKTIKEQLAEIIKTRIYPSALGRELPPLIGQHFPILIEASNEFDSRGVLKDRIIRTMPREELDLKLPSKLSFDKANIKDGLARIFAELAPPLEACRGKSGDTSSPNTEENKV